MRARHPCKLDSLTNAEVAQLFNEIDEVSQAINLLIDDIIAASQSREKTEAEVNNLRVMATQLFALEWFSMFLGSCTDAAVVHRFDKSVFEMD